MENGVLIGVNIMKSQIIEVLYKMNNILGSVIEYVDPISPPQYIGVEEGNIVHRLVADYAPKIRPLDSKYRLVSLKSMMKYLGVDEISEMKYIPRYHDCENFAFKLFVAVQDWAPNCPFGIVFGRDEIGESHSWNCFIADGKLWYIEPQDDKLFLPSGEVEWEIII